MDDFIGCLFFVFSNVVFFSICMFGVFMCVVMMSVVVIDFVDIGCYVFGIIYLIVCDMFCVMCLLS